MEFIKLDPATAFDLAIQASETNRKLIVCGSNEDIEYLNEAMTLSESKTEDIIEASLKINVETWFRNKMQYNQDLSAMDATDLDEDYDEDEDDLFEVSWNSEPAPATFSLATDILTGKPLTQLFGIEIQTDTAWHIPAYFKYGGWNECPEPEAHCAVWKYWEEKYGAKIVGVSNDVIEAYVDNPPQTEDEAMQLAMEQYLYCNDIVDQGVETVANLAATLFKQKVWYFWWD